MLKIDINLFTQQFKQDEETEEYSADKGTG